MVDCMLDVPLESWVGLVWFKLFSCHFEKSYIFS